MPIYIYAFLTAVLALVTSMASDCLCLPAWCQPAHAAETLTKQTSQTKQEGQAVESTQSEADASATAEPPPEDNAHQAKGTLIVRLIVPHMQKRTDTFFNQSIYDRPAAHSHSP